MINVYKQFKKKVNMAPRLHTNNSKTQSFCNDFFQESAIEMQKYANFNDIYTGAGARPSLHLRTLISIIPLYVFK